MQNAIQRARSTSNSSKQMRKAKSDTRSIAGRTVRILSRNNRFTSTMSESEVTQEVIQGTTQNQSDRIEVMNIKTCIDCGADISARGRNAKYCKPCSDKRAYERIKACKRKQYHRKPNTCGDCGEVDEQYKHYCEKCKIKHLKISLQMARKKKSIPPAILKCGRCGEEYQGNRMSRYCMNCLTTKDQLDRRMLTAENRGYEVDKQKLFDYINGIKECKKCGERFQSSPHSVLVKSAWERNIGSLKERNLMKNLDMLGGT